MNGLEDRSHVNGLEDYNLVTLTDYYLKAWKTRSLKSHIVHRHHVKLWRESDKNIQQQLKQMESC